MVRDKVEFPKKKAFRRHNSYLPDNEEFGDIDDSDALKLNFAKIRRSFDAKKRREIYNVKVSDVAPHRLKKDIMAVSETDSMGDTGM